jgi:hypothetical protein
MFRIIDSVKVWASAKVRYRVRSMFGGRTRVSFRAVVRE